LSEHGRKRELRELFLITRHQRGLTPAAEALATEVFRGAERSFGTVPKENVSRTPAQKEA
jgi:hypothetical protein